MCVDTRRGSLHSLQTKTLPKILNSAMTKETVGKHTGATLLNVERTAGIPPPGNSRNEAMGAKLKTKTKKLAVVIDSDTDGELADTELRHVPRSRERMRRYNLRELEIESNPSVVQGHCGPDPIDGAMERNKRSISLNSMRNLFRTQRGKNVPARSPPSRTKGKLRRLVRIQESPRSSFPQDSGSLDPIIGPLESNKSSLSPKSMANLFSTEVGNTPGSSRKAKLRRLVEVQDSPSTNVVDWLQTATEVGEIISHKGMGIVRRSKRLRNSSREAALLSEEEESDSDIEESGGGRLRASKRHVIDAEEVDSDSPDIRPVTVIPESRRSYSTWSSKHSQVDGDLYNNDLDVDDDEYDDSSFINDDSESDADPDGQSSMDGCTSSEIGEGSDCSGSVISRGSSDQCEQHNWELEGDMLAALAKDAELCLRGLCALYRRQEEDEKRQSASKRRNNRGFDIFRSAKASNLAKFLLGTGGSTGPVMKTAAQLKERFGDGAVTYCSDMCSRHSKQLFDIYQNNEDPHFCVLVSR